MQRAASPLLILVLVTTSVSGAARAEPTAGESGAVAVTAPARGTSDPLHPLWSPILLPVSVVAPGMGHMLRGDTETGRTFLLGAGALLGTGLLGAVGMAASGAADVPTGTLVPVVMVSMSSFLALGTADWIGALSASQPTVSADLLTDGWASTGRVGGGWVWAQDDGLGQAHWGQLFGEVQTGAWRLGGEVGTDSSAQVLLFGAEAARVLLPLEGAPNAGLWLRAGVLHESNARAGYSLFAGRVEAETVLPLGNWSPTLSRLSGHVRLGLRPWAARYGTSGWSRTHVELVGGSEVRWAATSWLRPYWGYEHGRDGLIGGQGTGFFGSFYGGAEVRLRDAIWLNVRGTLGTPNAVQAGVEHRW